MFPEYAYEIVRRANEERLGRALARHRLLVGSNDGYEPLNRISAEVIELDFTFECENTESKGA